MLIIVYIYCVYCFLINLYLNHSLSFNYTIYRQSKKNQTLFCKSKNRRQQLQDFNRKNEHRSSLTYTSLLVLRCALYSAVYSIVYCVADSSTGFFSLIVHRKTPRQMIEAIAIQILLIPIDKPAASAPISLWKVCRYHKTGILNTKTRLIFSTIVIFVLPKP